MIKAFCLFNGIDYEMFVQMLYAFFHFNMFDNTLEFINGCNHCQLPNAETVVIDEFLSVLETITIDYIVSLSRSN